MRRICGSGERTGETANEQGRVYRSRGMVCAGYFDMAGEKTLDPLRFRGAPPHCVWANSMSFSTRADAVEFMASLNAPAKRYWECVRCGGWHALPDLHRICKRT